MRNPALQTNHNALPGICTLAAALAWGVAVAAEPAATPDPATYLYDLPVAAFAGLPTEDSLPRLAEGPRLEEDDTAHRFQGCPVLVNDKIVAVFSRTRDGAGHLLAGRPQG